MTGTPKVIVAGYGHLGFRDRVFHVAAGPREWGLTQIHYMDRRFGRAGEDGIDAFAAVYGWDIRTWPGLDTLIAVCEIWGLRPYIRTARDRPDYGRQLAYRLHTLQSGNTQARWKTAAELAAFGPGLGRG